jgi:DNA-binding SARP family transcriptional activator
MRFGVLGPLAVWTSDGEPVPVPGLKVRALLADMLVHEARPVSVDRLADDLRGDDPLGNPAAALQAKVSQLRRALDKAEPGCREFVVSRSPGYLLEVDADAVDAGRFVALTGRASATEDPRARGSSVLADALALWRGPADRRRHAALDDEQPDHALGAVPGSPGRLGRPPQQLDLSI